MVELYELKLMPIDGDNNWPPDIDEHVAQLDFGTSMMDAQSVCFGSVIADPTLSTDSLDMDTMLRRCQDNKNNDYKLTFEDSGQWTTSGIGGSFTTTHTTTASPPTPQSRRVLNMLRKGANSSILVHDADNHNISLRLLEELNNGDDCEDEEEDDTAKTAIRWRDKLLDEILNNNGAGGASTEFDGQFTTWGRISRKSAVQSPPFDSDNVNSLPELSNERRNRNVDGGKHFPQNFSAKPCISSSSIVRHQQQSATIHEMEPSRRAQTAAGRPGSLVSNFIGQFHAKAGADEDGQAQSPIDYEYSEHYIGNGRYIDMNDNEIGFVPPSNAPIQGRNGGRRYQSHDSSGKTAASSSGGPCRRSESVRTGLAANSPRTFADLSPSRTAPDLKFIALSHKVPSICASSASFDTLLKQARYSTTFDGVLECCANSEKLLSENDQEGSEIPDSGLGSSHSDGPSHIEDWPSLSVLLPRPVVDACSFFKTNAFLLSGSSNSIERRRSPPPPPRSFTSTGICRRLSRWEQLESRPATACPNCCFGGSEAATSISKSAILGGASEPSPRRRHSTQRLRLHARELALIGLPIYDQKRTLVERVVEGVAEVLRGGPCIVLLAALEKLLGDGLKYGVRTWQVIRGVTGPGPVTASVFQLIEELEANEKPENSRISHFLQGLVSLHSVDGWFSYIVLKEGALRQFYTDSAFFIGASTSYRSLFARFVECLELLSVLNQCGMGKRNGALLAQKRRKQHSLNTIADHNPLSSAAKLPSDSRVPKSSSVPTKLTNKSNNNSGEEEDELEIEGQHGKDFTKNVPEILEPAQSETARPSKIPILRSRSKSTHSIQSNNSQRSSKMSTARVCHVRERVDENECEQRQGTVLPADKGESVKVLSVRGPYSRCARIGLKQGRRSLAIWNGILPTEKLVVMEDGC